MSSIARHKVQRTMSENNHEITMLTYTSMIVTRWSSRLRQRLSSSSHGIFHAFRFGLKENEAKLRIVPRGIASRGRDACVEKGPCGQAELPEICSS